MVAAALIAAFACPAQPALIRRFHGDVERTRIVACDGRRPVVVRRAAMLHREDGPTTGRRITVVDGAGRRIAWGEIRRGRGRFAGRILVGRFERGRLRVVHRRVVLRRPGGLDVVLTTRGELGWLTRGHVLTATIRGPARVVAWNGWANLALEDDRTLRWWRDPGSGLAYEDLRPLPGDGCPVRRRFRLEDEGPLVVATSSYFSGDAFHANWVHRACVRATGADPVVLQTDEEGADGDSFLHARVGGPWVAFVSTSGSRYTGCAWGLVQVINAVTGARGRQAMFPCDRARMPGDDDPFAVTDRGTPAWIVRGPEGLAIRWLHDGESRSAVLD